ncbi:hypothetical protein PVAP13_4NG071179 [Panicum virgatum]|uniref:Uncharacterized protein n=1 Tax=Panicum virgatum TaxID=38727 RepID=A0A8T0T5F2_PANVG|nr:hypothetical protein PVAP13_4NG071179 [Panicum virgatum]
MSDVLIQEPGLQSPDLPNTRAFRVQLIIIIYTTQLKATASPLQHRHRARAPLKVLKKSLPKFRFRTTNYRHLKPIPRFTRPREKKNYSRAHLGPVNQILAKQQ